LKIVDKINGKKVQFDVNENGLEFLNVAINGLQKTIFKEFDLKKVPLILKPMIISPVQHLIVG